MLQTPKGEWINGAVAGISIHLQPQRQHPPSMADLDNMYVDVGATSAEQARAGGADVLSPLAIDRHFHLLGTAGKSTLRRPLATALAQPRCLNCLRALDAAKIKAR